MTVCKWETPMVDGVKLIYNANFDAKCALTCPKDFNLKAGVALELKF